MIQRIKTKALHEKTFIASLYLLTVFCMVGLFVLFPNCTTASELPLFRHALENWPPDTYELVIVYHDELSAEEIAVVDWLEKNSRTQQPSSNYVVQRVDINSTEAAGIPALAEYIGTDSSPFFALLPPQGIRQQHVICEGPLTIETARTLIDSPLRRSIADRLISGDSIVWVLVESGNTLRDAEAIEALESGLEHLNNAYAANNPVMSLEGDIIMDIPVSFSYITLHRYDPLETYTIDLLLDGATTSPDDSNPQIVPVYGRGRALAVYRGDTADTELMSEVTSYLCEPATETAKDLYSGYDLLMPVDWNAQVTTNWVFIKNPTTSTSEWIRSLYEPFSEKTVITLGVLLAVAISLLMNIRHVFAGPHKSCLSCKKEGRFLSLNEHGLCRSCAPKATKDIADIRKSINTSLRVLRKTQDFDEITNHSSVIIEKAQKLQPYVNMGITVDGLNPALLIEQYTARRDTVLMEPLAGEIKKALIDAENRISPFHGIACIDKATNALSSARELVGNMGISARVIAFINQKGGVGKTTSTINVGAGLTRMNKKVLLIDFDPQANLTDGMGIVEEDLKHNVFDFLMGNVAAENVIIQRKGIDVIPAHMMLTRFEQESRNASQRNLILREALKNVGDYDYILIDCPPTLGLLTLNALSSAQDIFIPFMPEYFALKGIRKTFQIIEYITKTTNKNITMRGIVATRYDGQKQLHQEVVDKIEKSFGNKLYHLINEDISLSEASSYGQSIFEYEPKSQGAEDYNGFCQKILDGKRTIVAALSEG